MSLHTIIEERLIGAVEMKVGTDAVSVGGWGDVCVCS